MVHVGCFLALGLWVGVGIYSATVIYPLPPLATARMAILCLVTIGLLHGLLPTDVFHRTFLVSTAFGVACIGIFIRFTVFPFVYVNSGVPQDNGTTNEISEFMATQVKGNGATTSVWSGSEFRWYVSMGNRDVLPLLLPVVIPMLLIGVNKTLRLNRLKSISGGSDPAR